MKKIKVNLLVKVLAAIAFGVGLSFVLPVWAVRIFLTFNSVFSNFLTLFIPFLIIGLIVPGIADLGRGAGKLLLLTVALAYLSTILAGFFSYGVCSFAFPKLLAGGGPTFSGIDMSNSLEPFFTIDMPPVMGVTSALVVSFILGLGIVATSSHTLKNVMDEFKSVVEAVISKVIIPLLPLFIFGIFLKMGAEGNVFSVLGLFVKIIFIIFAMHITFLVFQFCIAGLVARKNPIKALVTMLPAYLTALGTQSSAATIPVTLTRTKLNGVRSGIADFTVPLCATIHISCSTLKIVACAYVISLSLGMETGIGLYSGFILMLGITMVAAPGVPGGAIMAALGLLSGMLGFNANMQGIMIALYITMDSFGTAGNVTGDCAISMIVDRISSKFMARADG